MLRHLVHTRVRDLRALANIEHFEKGQGRRYFRETGVAHGTVGHGQHPEAGQTRGHVFHAGVAHVVAEGDVQGGELGPSGVLLGEFGGPGEVAEADVADVVARAEIDLSQLGRLGQTLEARVGDADTKTEVDFCQARQTLAQVLQRFVRYFLAILEREVLEAGSAGRLALGIRVAGEVADAVVVDLAARPQVELSQVFQPESDHVEGQVGNFAAAAEIEDFEAPAAPDKPVDAGVADLLAQADVQLLEVGQAGFEGVLEGRL